MDKKVINSPAAPAAIGPYSQGIKMGNMVFTSGAIPLDPKSGEVVGTSPAEQAEQCLKNLSAVLGAENLTLKNVIKTTVFITDMAHFAEINQVYSQHFAAPFPARSCIAVKGLPKNVLIEIEAIAIS